MTRSILKSIAGASVCAALLIGCKALPESQPQINLPSSFGKADATKNLPLTRKAYFADSFLIALIDTVIERNLDGRMAMQYVERARAGVLHSRGNLFPAVSVGVGASVRRFGLYTMDGAGNSTTEIEPGKIVPTNLPDYVAGLQASWEADVWGKLRNRKKAAAARYLASVEGRHWLITNLVAEAASAYYQLLGLDQQLAILRENITIQENALTVVQYQKQAGATTELAVQQFHSQLLHTRELEAAVRQEIVVMETYLNFLMGRYPAPIKRSSNLLTYQLPLPQSSGSSDILLTRPDVRQAELELVAAKADVKAARAAFFPSLIINGGTGFQAYKTSLWWTTPESFVFSLIGNLSAPLLNRSAIRAEFNVSKAYQVEALYQYQKTILRGYDEVYNGLLNITTLQQRYQLKDQQVKVLAQSIETSSELFKTGRATYLEVLLAQQNTLQTRLELVEVRNQQLQAAVNVYRALGGGWK